MMFFLFFSLMFAQNITFIDANQLGKGGASTADISDVSAVLLNPAGITLLEDSVIYTSIQINNSVGVTDFTDIYFGTNLDGKVYETSRLKNKSGVTTRNSVGIFASYVTEQNFAYTIVSSMLYDLKYSEFADVNDLKVDTFSTIDTVMQISYAKSFLEKDKFRVGASAKTVYRVGKFRTLDKDELGDTGIFPTTGSTTEPGINYVNEGVAFLVDLGTQYSWFIDDTTVSFGISALDIGTPFAINPGLLGGSGRPPTIPARVQTGFGINFDKLFNSNYSVRTNFDVVKAVSYSESSVMDMLRLGIEFNFPMFLSLRAGLFQTYWTAGFSLRYWIGHVDFATYTENTDVYTSGTRPSDRRYVFQFSINL